MSEGQGDDAPVVSVLCTVRNAKRTLPGVIESIEEQTFEDWELVLVDDGSTDGTTSIVREASQKDARVRSILLDDGGRGVALNEGLRQARGRFVAINDADDPSHPDRLRVQVPLLDENPHMAVLASKTQSIGPDQDPEWTLQGPANPTEAAVEDVTDRCRFFNPIVHSTCLVRRSALMDIGGYDEDRSGMFDYDAWVRMAAGGWRIGRVDLVLASKRIHEGQKFRRAGGLTERARYVREALAVQHRAIQALGGGLSPYLALGGRAVWSMLPVRIRIPLGRRAREWIGT